MNDIVLCIIFLSSLLAAIFSFGCFWAMCEQDETRENNIISFRNELGEIKTLIVKKGVRKK